MSSAPASTFTAQDRINRFFNNVKEKSLDIILIRKGVQEFAQLVDGNKLKVNTEGVDEIVEIPTTGIDVHRSRMYFGDNIVMTSEDHVASAGIRPKVQTPSAIRPAAVRFFLADPARNVLCWSEKRPNGKYGVVSNLRAEVIAPYMLDDSGAEMFVHKITSCNFSVELPSPGGQTYIKEAAESRSVKASEMVYGVSNLDKTLNLKLENLDDEVAKLLVSHHASPRASLPKMGLRRIKSGDPRFAGLSDEELDSKMLDPDHADYRAATAAFCVSDVRILSVPTEWQIVRRAFLMDNTNGVFLLSPKSKKHAMSRAIGV